MFQVNGMTSNQVMNFALIFRLLEKVGRSTLLMDKFVPLQLASFWEIM